ncbi:rhodanese-like domain-containing protein [uncultured Clostridium sp.]|uniref:rhodanese-like domain-containing protein n=1 Tax=unclassified Clostridium TaxID=2614128 RepID=UPI001C8B626F|nr:rhodanese-like domain-containing protein [Clostridium sp. K12(2020)]MBX9143067.1 rhodanese-like domain-containing protein [Clostridium sp. K13]
MDTLESTIEDIVKDKDSQILVYCRSGLRSAEASKIIKSLGYNNIYDFGGIIDWTYEIEK